MSRHTKRDLFLDLMTTFREYTSAVDAVNQIIAGRMGINRTDHRVLEIIARLGPVTAGDLAAAGHLTTGAVTAVLGPPPEGGVGPRGWGAKKRRGGGAGGEPGGVEEAPPGLTAPNKTKRRGGGWGK